MADFRLFTALRYDPAVAGVASNLVAPPYDVVSEADRHELYARSAYNVSRIDYGVENAADSAADNRYTRAAAALAAWRLEGVLKKEEEPRLYVYDQEFTLAGERRSRRTVFGRLRLAAWEEGVVLPHEATGAAAKEDRLSLIEATGVHLSPIMALHQSGTAELLSERALSQALLDAELPGERHRLRTVEPEAAEEFCRRVGGQKLYIADGHHRYETGLNYRNASAEKAGGSWSEEAPENFILAGLVEMEDPGLIVLPTDRLLRWNATDQPIEELLSASFLTTDHDSLANLESSLEAAGREGPAFGLVSARASRFQLVVPRDLESVMEQTAAEHADAWRRLDVVILHQALLPPLGYEEAPENIDYTEAHAEAAARVREGEWELAVLLNPTPPEQIVGVADAGERMPRKTTFFYPKLATGVVLLPLE